MKLTLIILLLLVSLATTGQTRYIHVLVALCDNKNQGIVPVPTKIGNGQDPKNNLYWGCGYGVKTFLKKQTDWLLINQIDSLKNEILERLVFKHKNADVYLVADAYDGAYIRQTVMDFLNFAAGFEKQTLVLDEDTILFGGCSNLICYVGHDGLMDFSLESHPIKPDADKRETVILSCYSKHYFAPHLKNTGSTPLILTTGLMCPEAYTLDAIIDSWIRNETSESIKETAAQTYNRYQKCGIKGARNLFSIDY